MSNGTTEPCLAISKRNRYNLNELKVLDIYQKSFKKDFIEEAS